MGRIALFATILAFVNACAASPAKDGVSKARWVECWTICGKGDNLTQVTASECFCKGGWVAKKDEPKPEEKPFQLFEWLRE